MILFDACMCVRVCIDYISESNAGLGDHRVENKRYDVRHVDTHQFLKVRNAEFDTLSIYQDAVESMLPHHACCVRDVDAHTCGGDRLQKKAIQPEIEHVCNGAADGVSCNLGHVG